jgi:2-C-methyl-D-erythritol 4-phosphate cytidylyltransferase
MNSAIIVAAGKGTRMGPDVDKLFLELAGKPIIAHTWARFDDSPLIDEIILVARGGMEEEFWKIAELNSFKKPFHLTRGGNERQDSVWNGLQAVNARTELVAIQDGARPCTSQSIIEETIRAARETGAAVAAHKVTDTLKESDGRGRIAKNIDRSRLWAVQTPQVFRLGIIVYALKEVMDRKLSITDDTAACELIGQPVALVESSTPNPKATSRADLPYLELLLKEG